MSGGSGTKYDTIGVDYAQLRKADRRIGVLIEDALGSAGTVLNVGAGAGSYEPRRSRVTAVEPSAHMIAQRPADAAGVVQARAEYLPFADDAFDAAMAVLTVHHWSDLPLGLTEMRRVTRGPIVILTFDPEFHGFWLHDYLPGLAALDDEQMPRMHDYGKWLTDVEIKPVPVPHDCADGFLCAYWRRPQAYLDERIRAAISSFWALGDISTQLDRLARDLASGVWEQRYADLLTFSELDCGYRLVIAGAA